MATILPSPTTIRDKVWQYVIPQDFDMWAGGDKGELSKAILAHYYFREIGLETYGLWREYLGTRLKEIMPKYVSMATTLISFDDAILTQDETTSTTRTLGEVIADKSGRESGSTNTTEKSSSDHRDESSGGTTTNKVTSSGSGNATRLESDTPQNGLSDVIEGRYLSKAGQDSNSQSGTSNEESDTASSLKQDNTSSSHDTSTLQSNDSATYDRDRGLSETTDINRKGTSGDKMDMVKKYRDIYVNLTNMVIADLSDLFITIL